MGEHSAPRQLIICCDGTNNNLTGGLQDTNVVKLTRLIDEDRGNQILYYDPGVGNPAELPGATWASTISRHSERLAGLAFGGGVYENIQEAYRFLMRHYEDGDQIYFFGFSRGAFTARGAAGLVNQFGILRPHMESMLPTLLHVYFADRNEEQDKYQRITKQIKESFCHDGHRKVPIWFVGVWDTVASVGAWPFALRITAIPTIKDKQFKHVRQALALDEHRGPFKPRPYVDSNDFVGDGSQSMKQLWFRGSHCDAGGGYALKESAHSDQALVWLGSEAASCGLRLSANGTPIFTEDDIKSAISNVPSLSRPSPTIHSQTYDNCLWAIVGLSVRNTTAVKVDGSNDIPINPQEHKSVSQHNAKFPVDTAWATPRDKGRLLIVLVIALALALCMGELHKGHLAQGGSLRDLMALPGALSSYFIANVDFAIWQLFWWTYDSSTLSQVTSRSPRWALTLDLLFIAAYAYVLAWFSVRAFACVASLNRAGKKIAPWVNRLGCALPLLVASDIAENAVTFALISAAHLLDPVMLGCLGILMSLCAFVKYAALTGVTILMLWGALAPRNIDARALKPA
jgi:Uncharacterized alpha/beta hydrolase domain (DUF2235)